MPTGPYQVLGKILFNSQIGVYVSENLYQLTRLSLRTMSKQKSPLKTLEYYPSRV